MHRQVTECRICKGEGLAVLLELGTQALTGVFPRRPDPQLTKGPLTLARCDNCGLVQLLHSYERDELYGPHYGYRSSLNRRMVGHLESKALALKSAANLRPDGVWHLEQSYLPAMLRVNAYDTICHEHVEYYALAQIKWLADKVGLAILDVEYNDVNGGSFAVTLGRNRRIAPRGEDRVERYLDEERRLGLDTLRPFAEFRSRVLAHRHQLRAQLEDIRARGERVLGYGASTKGNVILQFAGIDRDLLPAIAEVNEDKFGCVTPGTWIPIIPEAEARLRKPDYFLVFPWHFRAGLIEREATYLAAGGKLMFPLPSIEVVSTSHR